MPIILHYVTSPPLSLSLSFFIGRNSQEVRPTDGRAGRVEEFWGTAEGAF